MRALLLIEGLKGSFKSTTIKDAISLEDIAVPQLTEGASSNKLVLNDMVEDINIYMQNIDKDLIDGLETFKDKSRIVKTIKLIQIESTTDKDGKEIVTPAHEFHFLNHTLVVIKNSGQGYVLQIRTNEHNPNDKTNYPGYFCAHFKNGQKSKCYYSRVLQLEDVDKIDEGWEINKPKSFV
ncbi:hypothetical protein [Fluviispira vulneris]|uniref:hypothetical protein n=1 Tax=Fluviispira vulneris TaxID=2763012 RepID=UPI0016487187|nr:hypothetical protein [Fluviispira vulneris]